MTQNFHTAFGLGADEKHIATVDEDDIALAAIQGMYERALSDEAQLQAQQELERQERQRQDAMDQKL